VKTNDIEKYKIEKTNNQLKKQEQTNKEKNEGKKEI